MKWFYRLFTLAFLGVAIGMPFFMKNKDNQPMLSLPTTKDLIPDFSGSSSSTATRGSSHIKSFYKWQDKDGVWHYGDMPPPENEKFDTIQVNSNANIIQSIPLESEEEDDSMTTRIKPPPGLTDSKEEILSLDRLQNIMNDTHSVADMMESRNDILKQMDGKK